MTALAAGRQTRTRSGDRRSDPVAEGVVLYAGAMYALDSTGYALPAGTAGAGPALAVVESTVDNTDGADGALTVEGRHVVAQYGNSASGDLIARTEIGELAYVVDDQTVGRTDGSGSRQPAGVIVDVDAQGVWIDVSAYTTALAALAAAITALEGDS